MPAEVPASFSATGNAELPSRWWTAFGNPALDRLVDEALGANFDLEAAWHRLRQARAVVRREAGDQWPELAGELQGEIRRPEERETDQLRLGLFAEYEVDLWGAIDSRVEAEQYRLRAATEDYRTAALSLSAEVARTWVQWITARQQLRLLEEQTETNREILHLIEVRFGSGRVRSVDILRQRQLVEATREEHIAAEARAQTLEHLLAVLVGRPPQAGVASETEGPTVLPPLPPLPETGVPLELVRRRPDLRRAFHRVHAADRDLAAAISARYPRLTLTASLTSSGDQVRELFDDWVAALGANLLAPLFQGGRLEAEVERTEAVRDRRLAAYAQATLTAFREVEDALVRERKQAERVASLEAQVDLAVQAQERLRTEYLNGVADYIDVLTALTEEQQLRRDLLAARRDLLEFRIALYRALAGGFETEREQETNDRNGHALAEDPASL